MVLDVVVAGVTVAASEESLNVTQMVRETDEFVDSFDVACVVAAVIDDD